MIHIYHGDGKGKTTAAFGLVMRQLGYQHKVLVVQFLKDGDSGEMQFLKAHPQVDRMYEKMPKLFYFQLDKEGKTMVSNAQHELFMKMRACAHKYDCIILDELLDAILLGMISNEEVISFLTSLDMQEVVITGRNPHSSLREMADYITEMKMEKHPYQKQVAARKGIEY